MFISIFYSHKIQKSEENVLHKHTKAKILYPIAHNQHMMQIESINPNSWRDHDT